MQVVTSDTSGLPRKMAHQELLPHQMSLDIIRGRVFCNGTEIILRPKSFALLSYLMQHPGRVISKDELLGAIWPQVLVTEDSLTRCVHEIRRALGELGESMLRTVPRRGYVLVLPLPASAAKDATPAPQQAPQPPYATAALRPDGVGVLPFVLNAEETPGQALIVEGLTHDVISSLARLRGFHVIARASTFALRHLATDPQAAGRALGVAHIVTGSAMIRAGRLRLWIDVVDTATSGILWTGEFSADLQEFADVIGALTYQIALTVHRQITTSEIRRALGRPPESLTAWEHFHAGLADVYSSNPVRLGTALGHFRDAARLAPWFAQAHAGQSVCHWVLSFTRMSPDPAADAAAASRTAEAAITADPDDPYSRWSLGRALGLAGDQAGNMREAKHAIALSPSFALGHFEITLTESLHGDAHVGLRHAKIFLGLSPLDPAMYSAHLAIAHIHLRLGQLDEAVAMARSCVAIGQGFPLILGPSALILAEAGAIAEARQAAAQAMALLDQVNLAQALPALSSQFATLFQRHRASLGF